jgi:hypothetical protein
MSNKITQWIFEGEGEHRGHVFVKDMYSIQYHGANPNTSYWCADCKTSVTVEDAQEEPAPADELTKG